MKLRLGTYDPERAPLITPLGILIHENGLADFGPKRVRKTATRMTEENVSPQVIVEFQEWAVRIPNELCAWVDFAWTVRMQIWAGCVGQRLPNGEPISQRKLDDLVQRPPRVILHADPFLVNSGALTAGVAYDDRVECVMAYLDQHNTWLRRVDALVAWEIGNLIGIRHGYRPSNPDLEIGSKVPCNLT